MIKMLLKCHNVIMKIWYIYMKKLKSEWFGFKKRIVPLIRTTFAKNVDEKWRLIVWSKSFRRSTLRETILTRAGGNSIQSWPRTWSIFLMAAPLACVLMQWRPYASFRELSDSLQIFKNITTCWRIL